MIELLRTRRALLGATAALAAAAVPAPALAASSPTDSYTTHGAWSFVSAPNLHPPKLKTTRTPATKSLAPGYFFVANFKNILSPSAFAGQGGPLILDNHLQPVWFVPAPKGVYTNNLAVQKFDGKPALSWWQGIVTSTGATTQGEDVVVDQRYRQVAHVTGQDGWVITQHEMVVNGHDAWVTVNKPVKQPDGSTVVDSGVQEIDLHTGKALYTWSALAHIPLSQAKVPAVPGFPRDAYHINSIQLLPGGHRGRMLVSMRNTWAGYLVDIATGNLLWTLGGSNSSYKLDRGSAFSWQHDIELHSNGLVTVFDDECCAITGPGKFAAPNGLSRGLELRLNFARRTGTFVRDFLPPSQHGSSPDTAFQGNMDLLPNGNAVVGWGSAPFVTEYSPTGKVLLDTVFPTPDLTYRAYVKSWVGLPPISDMRQVAKKSGSHTTIYASWDGATRVAAWRVLGGTSAAHLKTLAQKTKTTFETSIRLAKAAKVYKVQALDAKGHVLGTSARFSPAAPPPVYGGY